MDREGKRETERTKGEKGLKINKIRRKNRGVERSRRGREKRNEEGKGEETRIRKGECL